VWVLLFPLVPRPPLISTLCPYTTLFRSDVESTLEQIQRSFNGSVGAEHSHYSLREQIALAIVLTLSWYSNHAAKAAIARRMNALDRKSTRLNSSHVSISYAVFCLKKKIH